MMSERQAQPMIIRLPNGNIINVQSMKAAATLLGRIYHRISGKNDFHLDHRGLKNLIKCGILSFHEGPLAGYSFEILADNDDEHWDNLLDMMGAEGEYNQTYSKAKTRVVQELSQPETRVVQELSQPETRVVQELSQPSPSTNQLNNTSNKQNNNITTNQLNNTSNKQNNNTEPEDNKTEIDEFESMWNNSSQASKNIVPEDEFWSRLKQKAVTAPVVITENENKTEKSYSENLHSRYSV